MVGEVFRVAFERRESYDLDRPMARPWLYGIATNLLAKHRRREIRRLQATARLAAQRLDPADVAEGVSGALDASERWQRVAAAVNALPVVERDTLILHVWEGLGYQEIAAALDVPIGTVRSRLNRARGRLRELTDSRGEVTGENTNLAGRIGS
jgi:RNA polymerase sigma factor (sigma-70 family)